MKKDDIIALAIVALIAFSLGWTLHSQEVKYVSQQKTICEAKGGKYTLGWNDFGDYYYEMCQVPEKDIKL